MVHLLSICFGVGITFLALSASASESANPKVIIPIGGLCLDGTDPYCQGYPFSHCEVCFGCKSPPLFPNAPLFGKCECNEGYVAGALYGCLPVRGAGESCRVADQCRQGAAEKDSDCVHGTCQCGEGYVQEGKFCFPETKAGEINPKMIIPIGALCDPDHEYLCQGYPRSYCSFCFAGDCGKSSGPNGPMFYLCQCRKDYVGGIYGCLAKRSVNELCQTSSQCDQGAAGPLSKCVLGKCRCQKGAVESGKTCVPSS